MTSKSTRRNKTKGWLREHVSDPYVREAKRAGYRSRAVFKLLEIDARSSVFTPGATVVDLGAAPGGWSQVAVKRVGPSGLVVAVDILEMEPLPGVDFIHGDFREEHVLQQVKEHLMGRPVEVVLSDMAPNISGVRDADQAKSMHLAELTLAFMKEAASEGATGLIKVFHGSGIESFRREMRASFAHLSARKPKSSKDKSREFYLLGKGFHV